MTPKITYYFAPGACSMACHLLLEDAGLTYTATSPNLRDPTINAEFRRTVNIKGQTPVIDIDGEVITEAPAIITAISQLVPDKKYTGSGPLETVRFYEWINFLSGSVHTKAFFPIFRPGLFTTDSEAEAGVTEKAKLNVLAGFALVEEKLKARGNSRFAMGNHLTGVDAYLIVYWLWAERFGIDRSEFPLYKEVFERVAELPAYESMKAKQSS